MRGIRTALLGLALVLGIATAGAVAAPAQPARAWTLSSTVTISGALNGCGYGLQTAYVRGNLNGEIRTYNSPLGQPPHYSLTWDNVPGGSGGWAWIVVNCTVSSSYGVWVHVYRPWWGSTLTVNL